MQGFIGVRNANDYIEYHLPMTYTVVGGCMACFVINKCKSIGIAPLLQVNLRLR